jgi:diguanylate cyclase (GGDEF)-like protein/PAS domain S-box-containing protein/putative nucleotidyltransferase with HDIG domain
MTSPTHQSTQSTQKKVLKLLLVGPDETALQTPGPDQADVELRFDRVESLEAAWSRLEQQRVAAAVLDLSVEENCHSDSVLLFRTKASAVPVIVLASDRRQEPLAIKLIRAGAQDYLIKGDFDAHTLLHVVRSAMERQRTTLAVSERTDEFQLSEARLLSLIINNADGIIVVDDQGLVRFVNPSAEQLLQTQARKLLGRPFEYASVQEGNRELVITRPNGNSLVVDMRVVETPWESGKAFLISMHDITARKRAEEVLRESEERYALAVGGSKDGLWDWDLVTDEVYYSPRWKAIIGYGVKEIGTSPAEWFNRVHAEDLTCLRSEIAAHIGGQIPHFENEHRLLHKDGSYRWVLVRGTAICDAKGTAIRIAGSKTDITERKEAEKNLKQALSELEFALASEKVLLDELDRKNKELVELSITDGLTSLFNHRFLQERFDFEFKRAKRYGIALSCMLIDIDHFKTVNDRYGHQFGDLVLREIAMILRTRSREVDICGRYGGEEFMIITNQPLEGAVSYATKLHTSIENHVFSLGDHSIHVTVSIGVADYHSDIRTKQEMIERADNALYQAKEDGRNLIRVWKEQEQQDDRSLDKGGISELKAKVDDLSSKMRAMYVESTYALLRAVDTKDHYTQEHSQNVSNYSVSIAEEMGLHLEEIEVVKYAGLLHDIGRIGIDESILVKTDALTQKEYEALKKHPVIGANILKDVNFLEKEIPLVLYHHERYDGNGYPQGLKGREIPLGARILAVADAYDAMTTDRGFKRRMSEQEAIEELKQGKQTQFSPEIVDAFIRVLQRRNRSGKSR